MEKIKREFYKSYGFIVELVLLTGYITLPDKEKFESVFTEHCVPKEKERGVISEPKLLLPYSEIAGTKKRIAVYSVSLDPEGTGSGNIEKFNNELLEFMAEQKAIAPNYAAVVAMMTAAKELASLRPGTVFGLSNKENLYARVEENYHHTFYYHFVSSIQLGWKYAQGQRPDIFAHSECEPIVDKNYGEITWCSVITEEIIPALKPLFIPKMNLANTDYPYWGLAPEVVFEANTIGSHGNTERREKLAEYFIFLQE